MRKSLSVVLATHNEEKNLAACLDSIKDIADEIIVVDGSSKDKTVDIAKKFGAKIKVTTNKPIFHINKQMAIDMATKDWILQLDADERVSEELRKEILSTINNRSISLGLLDSTVEPKISNTKLSSFILASQKKLVFRKIPFKGRTISGLHLKII